MTTHPPSEEPFEPDFVELMREVFEQRIAFNRVLGFELTSFDAQRPSARITMKPELIGHFLHQRLHGGVTSATLDAIGGFAVMLALGQRHRDEPPATRAARFAKVGTIDLRIDYLRPAVGPHFAATAQVLRLGSRVASTRMELAASDGELVATGSAAYIVS